MLVFLIALGRQNQYFSKFYKIYVIIYQFHADISKHYFYNGKNLVSSTCEDCEDFMRGI